MESLAGMRANRFALLIALSLSFVPASSVLAAHEIEFVTENDLFTDDSAKDDLYTFAVALETELRGTRFALREDAFTDRAAGTRFDETSWSLGRRLRLGGAWQAHAEAGAVRIGRGIFGEKVQNTVHRALGSDVLALAYLPPSVHGRLALAAERSWTAGGSLAFGPRLELEWVSDVRSHAVLAGGLQWQPRPALAVDLLAGVRWSDADLAALAPHILPVAAVGGIGVTLFERVRIAWRYNDHGDGRTHLAVAYRFSRWRGAAEPSIRE